MKAILFLWAPIFLLMHNRKCEYPIFIDENERYYNIEKLPDTIRFNKNDLIYEVIILTCKGKMTLTAKDTKGNLRIKGGYLEGDKIITDTVEVYDLTNNKSAYKKRSYYRPIKDSVWNYYNLKQ